VALLAANPEPPSPDLAWGLAVILTLAFVATLLYHIRSRGRA
jgi:hypothetical protein